MEDGTKKDNPAGCSACHIGGGAIPTMNATQTEKDKIDCLFCHADIYKYDGAKNKKMPIKTGQKEDGTTIFALPIDDSAEALASVGGLPNSDNCRRCHDYSAGGLANKRGFFYDPKYDVHAAKGVTCLDCHPAKDHKIAAGNIPDLWANDMPGNPGPECNSCHGARPHTNAKINDHAKRLDCRTCHVPYQYGLTERDWSKPVKNPETGLFAATETAVRLEDKIFPVYSWYNGLGDDHKHKLSSTTRKDSKAKITPFMGTKYTVLVDKESGASIPLKLGVYYTTGNIEKAIQTGVADYNKSPLYNKNPIKYSGQWTTKDVISNFSIGHRIQPKSKALTCNNCHGSNGRLDFGVLGYSPDEVKKLKFLP